MDDQEYAVCVVETMHQMNCPHDKLIIEFVARVCETIRQTEAHEKIVPPRGIMQHPDYGTGIELQIYRLLTE